MTDFYIRKTEDFFAHKTGPNVIANKQSLKLISSLNYKEERTNAFTSNTEWYPLTNSYYPYTEDVDAFARVNHLLETKTSTDSLTSVHNCTCDCIYKEDPYSERAAQIQYLTSNPVSFLILGKPGLGEQELGKLLAEYWNCVLIEPETLIAEEISSGTRVGQCIEFNLRSGRAIGVDIVLRLLEKRVKSKSAQHRGFVVCGFPLIPNELYVEEPVSSETTYFGVKDIFEDLLDVTVEIGNPPPSKHVLKSLKFASEELPEEEEDVNDAKPFKSEAPPSDGGLSGPPPPHVPPDLGSTGSGTVCDLGNLEKNFEEQLQFIFDQFQEPFVLIYVVCDNADVISKHADSRFECYSRQTVDLQREYSDKIVYTYFSRVPGATSEEIPEDFMDVVKSNAVSLDSSKSRLLVKLPRDFPVNMASLLDRYRYSALPLIEKYVLGHPVEYFFKTDGRISPVRMFHAVKTKLRVLPLQKVVVPEKLLTPPDPEGEGPVDTFNAEEMAHEEFFEIFSKKLIPSPMFKWTWSDWKIKCPVSMKEGAYEDGDPRFAVHFMNKIYFLCNEDAFLKFYRNPRPYLLPPFPKSSCKVYVIGPPCSGKTAVAHCLGYLLEAEVLNYHELTQEFLKHKQNEYREEIRLAAVEEGVALLNEIRKKEWDRVMATRQEKIEEWMHQQQDLLRETIRLKENVAEEEEDVTIILEVSSFPTKLCYNRSKRRLEMSGSQASLSSEEAEKIKNTVEALQELIKINGLPGVDDLALCEELLANPDRLLDYLPPTIELPEPFSAESATADDDFVKGHVEAVFLNISYEHVELTPEYISEMLIDLLDKIQRKNELEGNKTGGWIVDGIPLSEELFDILFVDYRPHDLFLLKDPEHDFLAARYETRGLNEFRDYKKFFSDIGKKEVAWRSPSLHSTESYKNRIVKDFITDMVDDSCVTSEMLGANSATNDEDPYFRKHRRREVIEAYIRDIIKFETEWESVLPFISEHKITIVEIEVTNKTLDELLSEVILKFENKYRQLAVPMTPEERAQELEDFGEPEMQGEELGEGEEKTETVDTFFQNRRFGDTFNYCPVTFSKFWVLWRGKEEHAAKYEDKVYLMCDEDSLNSFTTDPRKYLLGSKPADRFPPPRICIVGPCAAGKTSVSRALSRSLGLYHTVYEDELKVAIAPKSKLNFLDILKLGIGRSLGEKVHQYLASDEPLPDALLKTILSPLWFEEPIQVFGFVLDGFPKRPSDVDYMVQNAIIPDIIVEMSLNVGEVRNRLMQKHIDDWNDAKKRGREIRKMKKKEMMEAWLADKTARFKELVDQRRQERKTQRPYMEDLVETDEEQHLELTSQISYESVADEADIEEIEQILAEEFPEPVLEEEDAEETYEDALAKFANDVEDSFATELNYLRLMRDQCELELIPWVTVDAGMPADKVLAQVMRVVDKYKFRNNSLFERVYDISVELADKLLGNGYYFLSKFGKTCPVQIYENLNPVQLFLPLERKFQLFPVIHRQYIYFLAKRENWEKFQENPLKYVSQKFTSFPLVPFRIAIIGPPKSGKTTLANRFQNEMGLKAISPGRAGRYVLRHLEFSDLAKNMDAVLRSGAELTNEMMMKTIEALSFDGNSITQGFVMDGFPTNNEQIRALAQMGLVPHLVLDLQTEKVVVDEFLAGDQGKLNLPTFSKSFVTFRYNEWMKSAQSFRQWLDREYQVMGTIKVRACKWGIWNECFELMTAVSSEIKHYYKFAYSDMVLRLANMQITPLEFLERQGSFKHYCPACLYYESALVSGGEPPDRTGVVQFRAYYYYLCSEHIEKFIEDPEMFLAPYNSHLLPKDLPVWIDLEEIPDNCYQEGLCVVCYWTQQPRRVLNKGLVALAVLYRENVYLFDELDCLNKFMRKPRDYFAVVVSFKGTPYPSLTYKELPTLGLLQQYDVKQLIKAINNTTILRPVVPGLTIAVSGCINIGLFMKLNNPRTPMGYMDLYAEANRCFQARRIDLMKCLDRMKGMVNPYLYYDEPVPKFEDPIFDVKKRDASEYDESTAMSSTELGEKSEASSNSSDSSDGVVSIDEGGGGDEGCGPDEGGWLMGDG